MNEAGFILALDILHAVDSIFFPFHPDLGYSPTMNPHGSPDHPMSTPTPGNASLPHTPSERDLSQFCSTPVSIRASNFTITLGISPALYRPIDTVTVEIYSKDKIPIVTYQTDSAIPASVAKEILEAFQNLKKKLETGELIILWNCNTPETFLKYMVTIQHFLV